MDIVLRKSLKTDDYRQANNQLGDFHGYVERNRGDYENDR